jgi:hypothetical protein
MVVATSDDLCVKTKRRSRNNKRRLFHFRRNICCPLSPMVEDLLGLREGDLIVEEQIEGTRITLRFERMERSL